jgi:hypothetical protein
MKKRDKNKRTNNDNYSSTPILYWFLLSCEILSVIIIVIINWRNNKTLFDNMELLGVITISLFCFLLLIGLFCYLKIKISDDKLFFYGMKVFCKKIIIFDLNTIRTITVRRSDSLLDYIEIIYTGHEVVKDELPVCLNKKIIPCSNISRKSLKKMMVILEKRGIKVVNKL